jgi:uncharacterized protein (DUF2344 family)
MRSETAMLWMMRAQVTYQEVSECYNILDAKYSILSQEVKSIQNKYRGKLSRKNAESYINELLSVLETVNATCDFIEVAQDVISEEVTWETLFDGLGFAGSALKGAVNLVMNS